MRRSNAYSCAMSTYKRIRPALIFIFAVWAAATQAQGGYGLSGELLAADRVHARKALENRFGQEVASSYRLVANGCFLPSCTDVQSRTAVYVRAAAPLGVLRREYEVHCSAPAGSARGWTCGLPGTHYFIPTTHSVVRASVAGDVDDDEVRRLAAYLQSECNEIAVGGSISVRKSPRQEDAQKLWVWVGLTTFTLQPSPDDAGCPLRIERTGRIVT